MLEKIIAGSETGAERAALDAALNLGFPRGGCLFKGRITESGRLDIKYKLHEMATTDYPKRTVQNVIDSDGTVIFQNGELTGGLNYTEKMADKHHKPFIYFDLNETLEFQVASILYSWVVQHEIKVLNVAGSNAIKDPRIYDKVLMIIESVLLLDLKGAEPGQYLVDYSVQEYMKHIPALEDSSKAAVEQIINDLPLRDQVKIANMDEFDVYVLQTIFNKYIITWTGLEPEANIVRTAWKKLRKSHRLRAIKS